MAKASMQPPRRPKSQTIQLATIVPGWTLRVGSLPAYKAAIRAAMRRAGLIDLPSRSRAPLGPVWSCLHARLPDRCLMSLRLQDFMAHCDSTGIVPEAVNESALLSYAELLRQRRLTRSPVAAIAGVRRAWNRCVDTIPGWPQRKLENPAPRQLKTIPPATWPEAFRADVDRFVAQASMPATGNIFAADAAGPILRPATIKGRRYAIRVAVTHFVGLGHALDSLVALDQLLEPVTMQQIMARMYEAEGHRLTGSLKQLGDSLRSIARYRHPEDSLIVVQARRLARTATPPKQKSISERNELRLMQFVDRPERRDALLMLPEALFTEARDLRAAGHARDAAWKAASAVAIAIELRCPLRLNALTHLRFGEELVRTVGSASRWSQFVIAGDIHKVAAPLRWPIAPDLSAALDTYAQEFRPLGPHPASPWLFPARDTALTPRAPGGLSRSIIDAIFYYVGARMTVHLFRGFAGMLLLEANPDGIDDLRQLLGHATLDTALRYYALRQKLAAAARIDALLDSNRAAAAAGGLAALEKQRPRRHAGSLAPDWQSGTPPRPRLA